MEQLLWLPKFLKDYSVFSTQDFQDYLQLKSGTPKTSAEALACLRALEGVGRITEVPCTIKRESDSGVTWLQKPLCWSKILRQSPDNDVRKADAEPEVSSSVAKISETEFRWRKKWRKDQEKFRTQILEICKKRCQLSDCRLTEILEAAHVQDYAARGPSIVENGLLLRADLHSLFDRNHIGIHPDTHRVVFSARLLQIVESGIGDYAHLNPKIEVHIPNREFLGEKFEAFKKANPEYDTTENNI